MAFFPIVATDAKDGRLGQTWIGHCPLDDLLKCFGIELKVGSREVEFRLKGVTVLIQRVTDQLVGNMLMGG